MRIFFIFTKKKGMTCSKRNVRKLGNKSRKHLLVLRRRKLIRLHKLDPHKNIQFYTITRSRWTSNSEVSTIESNK